MSKFSIASLMAKINTDALKARFKSVRKNRARLIPLVAIAALALIGLWFVNDLLDGALFTALLFVLFIVAFSALIFTCAPEESVKFIEQVIEESKAHWAKLKRSFKRLRELLKKSPEVVVDEEAEKVASAPSPVTPASAPTRPAPVTTPRTAKTTRESSTAVPPAVPAPVKSSATVAGGPDALGKVAAATRRRGRAGRVLSMPDDGSDKS
jgi:predicted PurR-regulated permease PerM